MARPKSDNNKDGLIQIRCDRPFIVALDDLRRRESEIPSRSEMVRILVERAAGALKKRA
jgi:hypothetical protein